MRSRMRSYGTLSAALALCLVLIPASAQASERVALSLAYGPMFSKKGSDNRTQPSLWMDAGVRVVGPLQIGAFAQGIGDAWGFKSPAFGGGLQLALRPTIARIHIIADVHAGYLRFPATSTHTDGVWNFGGTLGLGVSLVRWVGLEVRTRYSRFFNNDSAPTRAWTLEGALAFYFGGRH